MIQEDIFEKINPVGFSQATKLIRSGDLIFCSGNGVVSRLIREATGSIFSHVGLLLQLSLTKQWLVLESVESIGVRCVTLFHGYVKNYQDSGQGYNGNILIARHQDFEKKIQRIKDFYQHAFELMGDKYSTIDIFRIATRIALNKIGIHENGKIMENHRYICSEYVYSCLKAVDIQLPYNSLGFIAPSNIARHESIYPVCYLATIPILPSPLSTRIEQSNEPLLV